MTQYPPLPEDLPDGREAIGGRTGFATERAGVIGLATERTGVIGLATDHGRGA